MPVRNLETYINEGTLKDLIIEHLYKIRVINDREEITDLSLSEVHSDGLRTLSIRFEPDAQIIFHP